MQKTKKNLEKIQAFLPFKARGAFVSVDGGKLCASGRRRFANQLGHACLAIFLGGGTLFDVPFLLFVATYPGPDGQEEQQPKPSRKNEYASQ